MAEEQEKLASDFKTVKNAEEHFSYIWVTNNWNTNTSIESAVFPDKPLTEVTWKMIWKYENLLQYDSRTLFLHLVSAPLAIVRVKYSLTFCSANNVYLFCIKDIIATFDNCTMPLKSNLEHSSASRLNPILRKFYSTSGTLIIHVHIWAVVTEPKPKHNIEPMCQHDYKLAEDIGRTFDNGTFSDVSVNVGRSEFKAHRHILAARSPVFAAMLKHDMLEKRNRCISIVDFEADTIQMLLLFIYKGHVNIPNDKMASDLLRAADQYAINDLKKLCVNYFVTKLDQQNVLDALLLGELHHAPDLKQRTTAYFLAHLDDYDLNCLTMFESIEKCRPNLLSELLLEMAVKCSEGSILENIIRLNSDVVKCLAPSEDL